MSGVDFVINALFETSGLRWAGDCAMALAVASSARTMKKKVAAFTGAMVVSNAEPAKQIACSWRHGCSSVSRYDEGDALRTAKRLQHSISLLEFAQQLLL